MTEKDPYREMASELYQVEMEAVSPEQRRNAKIAALSIRYSNPRSVEYLRKYMRLTR